MELYVLLCIVFESCRNSNYYYFFTHKNSITKHIFILNLRYLFIASYKEAKCLSWERF